MDPDKNIDARFSGVLSGHGAILPGLLIGGNRNVDSAAQGFQIVPSDGFGFSVFGKDLKPKIQNIPHRDGIGAVVCIFVTCVGIDDGERIRKDRFHIFAFYIALVTFRPEEHPDAVVLLHGKGGSALFFKLNIAFVTAIEGEGFGGVFRIDLGGEGVGGTHIDIPGAGDFNPLYGNDLGGCFGGIGGGGRFGGGRRQRRCYRRRFGGRVNGWCFNRSMLLHHIHRAGRGENRSGSRHFEHTSSEAFGRDQSGFIHFRNFRIGGGKPILRRVLLDRANQGNETEGLTRNQLFIGDIQHKGWLGFRTFAGRCFKLTAYKNLLTAGRKGAKYQKEPCKQRKFQLFHSSWIHPFPWKIILYRRFGTKWCRIKSRENLRKSRSRWHSRSPLRQEQ